jgi:hypothetical protein
MSRAVVIQQFVIEARLAGEESADEAAELKPDGPTTYD